MFLVIFTLLYNLGKYSSSCSTFLWFWSLFWMEIEYPIHHCLSKLSCNQYCQFIAPSFAVFVDFALIQRRICGSYICPNISVYRTFITLLLVSNIECDIWFIACNISLSLSHFPISLISVQYFIPDTITNLKLPGDDVSLANHRPDAMNHTINVTRIHTLRRLFD